MSAEFRIGNKRAIVSGSTSFLIELAGPVVVKSLLASQDELQIELQYSLTKSLGNELQVAINGTLTSFDLEELTRLRLKAKFESSSKVTFRHGHFVLAEYTIRPETKLRDLVKIMQDHLPEEEIDYADGSFVSQTKFRRIEFDLTTPKTTVSEDIVIHQNNHQNQYRESQKKALNGTRPEVFTQMLQNVETRVIQVPSDFPSELTQQPMPAQSFTEARSKVDFRNDTGGLSFLVSTLSQTERMAVDECIYSPYKSGPSPASCKHTSSVTEIAPVSVISPEEPTMPYYSLTDLTLADPFYHPSLLTWIQSPQLLALYNTIESPVTLQACFKNICFDQQALSHAELTSARFTFSPV